MKYNCKYCGSEMDLTEDDVDCMIWTCMNEDCRATLTITEGNYDIYEDWEQSAVSVLRKNDDYYKGFKEGYIAGLNEGLRHYKDLILNPRPLIITVANQEELKDVKNQLIKE
jgi:hypothetical protein